MVRVFVACLVVLSIGVSGCTGQRLPPPPEAPSMNLPPVRGFEGPDRIRFWGDLPAPSAEEQFGVIRNQIAARFVSEGELPNEGDFDVLVLSGGGSDGAYGAGLLNGWSDRGDRPEFGLVTGISVGALIAPLAFLGEDYDDELERLFTMTSSEEIFEFNILQALFGRALGLTDVMPLELRLDRIITPAVVRRIAQEHRKGRRLWIGTTYLDAQRPVIWDIGVIAASNDPGKHELIKKIILASAAVPGAFPPVLIPVEVDGQLYSEMHVDGAVTRQLFVYPENFDLIRQVDERVRSIELGTIYLVRNTKLAPDYQPVHPSIPRIVERSISTMIKAVGLSDVEMVEQQAKRDGWGLMRTSVPLDFDFPQDGFFDPQYMSALYEVGYQRALAGVAWQETIEREVVLIENEPEPDRPLTIALPAR